ncbi:MAG: hypothetical protein A2Y07_11185 [Planctomycetes bacterium GWF2_50_10]|nr:MAG: hypothetical protein A2Y07_11185 [Planctomycetes bacterium GWF2_50_10]
MRPYGLFPEDTGGYHKFDITRIEYGAHFEMRMTGETCQVEDRDGSNPVITAWWARRQPVLQQPIGKQSGGLIF